jgi:hypothetical protein
MDVAARDSSTQSSRVVEPELDMNRQGSRMPAGLYRMWQTLWMRTPGRLTTAAPMRSVGRELEERWPSREH